jgi:molybdopterin-guanine dinucleotide biosynthesis protein A
MIATEDITGLILAGGAGRRVEGRDKGLIDWQGKPLVKHVAEGLRPQVGQLVISCNRNVETYRELADKTVTDSRGDFQGPLAGLEAASSLVRTMFLVVVACDTPTLPVDLVARLLAPLDKTENDPIQISYAHDGQRGQYLCAAINTRCLPSLTAYLDEGHRTVHGWYQRHTATAVDFSDTAASFSNLNRMA